MRRRRRNQHAVSLDRKSRLAGMAEAKPDARAAKVFVRKTYECCDMLGYMTKKYDVKGEIGIGEKDIGADKELP